jgi:hypothetical protein
LKATDSISFPAGRKQIPRGTFRSILRQSGLDESAFDRQGRKVDLSEDARRVLILCHSPIPSSSTSIG